MVKLFPPVLDLDARRQPWANLFAVLGKFEFRWLHVVHFLWPRWHIRAATTSSPNLDPCYEGLQVFDIFP